MQIKRAIRPYVFGGLMLLLSGCGSRGNSTQDNSARETVDKFTRIQVEESDKVTDNYITINRLLRRGEYEAAQDSLENYLENKMIEAAEIRGGLSEIGFSPNTERYLEIVLGNQIKQISHHLRDSR